MTSRKEWPVSLSSSLSGSMEETLTKYQKAGIHYMELTSASHTYYMDDINFLEKSKEIFALAKGYGVTIRSIHIPFSNKETYDNSSPDPAVRDNSVRYCAKLLAAAAEAGIKIAVIHPSNEPYSEDERESRITSAIDTLSRITAIADALGMTLAVENLPRTCICRTSDEMKRILVAIPKLKVCFDTNHSLIESNVDYIRAVGDRIIALHVSDYDFIDERHLLPGEGLVDWEELITTLEEVGYTGTFNYELAARENATADAVAANYKRLMKI